LVEQIKKQKQEHAEKMEMYQNLLKRLNGIENKRREAERKATEQVNGNVSYGL